MTLLDDAQALAPRMVEWRRTIHCDPELGNHLPRTQGYVLSALREMGVDAIRTGDGQSSVVATIESGRPGPTTLLRADMDALPIQEPEGLEFRSTRPGVMHACGHDAHTSMLLGAAALLCQRRAQLNGRVVLAFQPGEEGHGGAKLLVREGVLEGVTQAFAVHVAPPLPAGLCGGKSGAMMASSDTFRIEVEGAGGHGSSGGGVNSTLSMAARLAVRIEMLGEGEQTPDFIASVGMLHAGTSPNVLPSSATLEGTLRAFSEDGRAVAISEIESQVQAMLEHSAMHVSVQWDEAAAPVTVNDEEVFARVRAKAARVLGDEACLPLFAPVAASEDFGVIAGQVPATLLFVGSGDPERDCGQVHSPSLVIDERCLPVGAALYASVALTEGEENA